MTFEAGITLGILGSTMTIVGLSLAYYFGSKEDKEVKYEDLSSVHKSLRDLLVEKENDGNR